ncbi:MAG TPA: PAS domain S-box protein [Bryobacteraceae bacterium]|nr:PAS domain S-box protein [Bryobacteraceae bacterium]
MTDDRGGQAPALTYPDLRVLRAALEATPNAVIITDSSGTIQWTNPAFTQMTGYNSTEACGRTPRLLKSGKHDGAFYKDLWDTIRSGASWSGEVINRRKDGRLYAERQTITPVRNGLDEITHFIAFAHDVTEHKRVQDALTQSEERFRNLVETTSDWIWEVDEHGRYTYVSPRVRVVLGYEPDELLGKTPFDFMAADESQRVRELFARYAGLKLPFATLENVNLHKDGSAVVLETSAVPFCDDHGVLLGYRGVDRDITIRKRGEAALRESEARLKRAQRLAQLGDWELDLRAGTLTWSDEVYSIFAVARESFTPTRAAFLEVVHPDDREKVQAAVRDALSARSSYQVEHRIVRPTGEQRHVREYGEIVLKGEEPVRILGTVQDVTEHRNIEEQLRQALKMEAVGRLAGGVAHDFNNLLTVIHGYSDSVLNGLEADSPLRNAIEEIRAAGVRAAALTRQLLAFSRRAVPEWQVLNINETVIKVERMLRRLIGEDIELRTRLDPALGFSRADPNQLEQVIMNLAVNARDAMPEGGTLTIETRNVGLDATYASQHVDVEPGPYIVLSVSDTGIGMAQEVMDHLFEPYFTTKQEGKGTGLGLSTVYGIVRRSQGHIRVYSEPGHGTAFYIYLPRVSDKARSPAITVEGQHESGGCELILVVEDDDQLRRMACWMLRGKGYTVLEASTGAEALRVAEHAPGVALVLTDMVMPGMSGGELACQLRALNPKIRILFMSGYSDEAVAQRCPTIAGSAFVQKPFSPQTLSLKLRELLDSGSVG